jgi:hypothetical protein
MHCRAMVALFLYLLVWGASIAFAAATNNAPGWSIGNVLMLCGTFSAIITGLIGYIFTSQMTAMKEASRLDREAAIARDQRFNQLITTIFSELREKKDKTDCKDEMKRIDGDVRAMAIKGQA